MHRHPSGTLAFWRDRLLLTGYGGNRSRVTEILRQLCPQEASIPILEDCGWDQTEIPNQRAEALLKGVKHAGWASLVESVCAAAQCFL